jgi:hypothetical protein
MAGKRLWLGLVIVTVVLLCLGGCSTPPPVNPGISQTVITIQRGTSNYDKGKKMEVFIDGIKQDRTIANGQSSSFIVNDGVHQIYVNVGSNNSEILNFTAAQKIVPFFSTVESGGVLRSYKVVLSRSVIEDNTGSMTNRETQSAF